MNDVNAPDALTTAIANEVEDVIHAADAVLKAAGCEDVSTLARATALVELSAVNARMNAVIDRLTGFSDAMPEDAA